MICEKSLNIFTFFFLLILNLLTTVAELTLGFVCLSSEENHMPVLRVQCTTTSGWKNLIWGFNSCFVHYSYEDYCSAISVYPHLVQFILVTWHTLDITSIGEKWLEKTTLGWKWTFHNLKISFFVFSQNAHYLSTNHQSILPFNVVVLYTGYCVTYLKYVHHCSPYLSSYYHVPVIHFYQISSLPPISYIL